MKAKIISVLILLMVGCTVPQDPEHSFENAKNDKLLVGVVNNPPFVNVSEGTVSGSEIEKIKDFANRENLQIQFIRGSESELVKKLEKFELHIVAGGFSKKTIWKKKAGLSATYDKDHVFLLPKGENRLLKHVEDYIYKQKNK
jgi:polar amino acid transport system substrate-binding protein